MSTNSTTNLNYVNDDGFVRRYIDYQSKYSKNIRESDKVILAILNDNSSFKKEYKLLDIGCSTGNLLLHIKNSFPNFILEGGDYSQTQVDVCRKNKELKNITFNLVDIKNISHKNNYDFITVNAVFYGLNNEEFKAGLRSIYEALKPGGMLIAWDFFHEWEQELIITEKIGNHPSGHNLHFRPYSFVNKEASSIGFKSLSFNPFEIGIDLEKPDYKADNLVTYTLKDEYGKRIQFRGGIAQPWNHLTAIK